MSYVHPEVLVSTDWLTKHLEAPDVRVVDASWYLPQEGRDALIEYQIGHIPGAVFFDIDEIADSDNPLPHMVPSAEKFTSRVRKMGLGDGNCIVVYDGGLMASAARVWWMFRLFGHDDVAVLDGGLGKWRAEERPLEDLPPVPRNRHFTARLNSTLVRDLVHVRRLLDTNSEQVLDARSAGRFEGTAPEPREGLPSGHMPGSLNLPFTELLDDMQKTMLPAEELRQAFAKAGVDLHKPVTTTCGSGVTAALLALGLHLLGHRQVAVYDSSWSEWASRDDTPIEP